MSAGGMDAHLLGACALFFMPGQGAALRSRGSGDDAGHDVVALIGLFVTMNHYNYAK